jgi:hypothetical protein
MGNCDMALLKATGRQTMRLAAAWSHLTIAVRGEH